MPSRGPKKPKTISLRLPTAVYERLVAKAAADNRNISNYILTLLLKDLDTLTPKAKTDYFRSAQGIANEASLVNEEGKRTGQQPSPTSSDADSASDSFSHPTSSREKSA